MSQAAHQLQTFAPISGEELTAAQWARLLDVHRNNFYQIGLTHSGLRESNGQLGVKVYRYASLPEHWRQQLEEKRRKSGVACFADLLSLAARPDLPSDAQLGSKTPEAREKAAKWRIVMQVYCAALEAGMSERQSNAKAQGRYVELFGKACNEKSIRRKAQATVDVYGGWELTPLIAYCDAKDVPHKGARLENKGIVPAAFIAALKARAVRPGMEHMRAAFRSLEIDWLMGREVPGFGATDPLNPVKFPLRYDQVRKFMPSTPARRLGSHGQARAQRECLPYVHMTRALLRRGQRFVLDDTRVDIICTDDLTGEPIELKSYWMLDCGPRRIEGWVCEQSTIGGRATIKAASVDALLARVLRSTGLSPLGAELKFERGAVACSPAAQSLLEGMFPFLKISRTSMDGGKNHAGDWTQTGSGHWMGKAEIESFMRTFAFFVQHLPGQRGGWFRRQPSQLGLKGRNPDTGFLSYMRGSQIGDSARHAYADRALAWIDNGLGRIAEAAAGGGHELVGGRIRLQCLLPRSEVERAFREFVSYYNNRSDHRMEGFAEMVHIDPETGVQTARMETPNERALALEAECPPQRISDADCSLLLTARAKPVTCTKDGITLSVGNLKGARFFAENSLAVSMALRNANGKKEFVALWDDEAFSHWTPDSPYALQIYLLADSPANWQPGQPGRFLEALPLASVGDITDPQALAELHAEKKRIVGRYERELLRAAAPDQAQMLAEASADEQRLRSVVTVGLSRHTPQAGESQLSREVRAAHRVADEAAPVTRAQQQASVQETYAQRLARIAAEHAAAHS